MTSFDTKDQESFSHELKTLPDNVGFYSVEEATIMYKKWRSLKPAKRKEFLAERLDFVYETVSHSKKLDDWLASKKMARPQKIRELKTCHKISVLNKLRALGYTNGDFYPGGSFDESGWKWDSLLHQPRKLTERTWNNIRWKLEQTIHLRREKRRLAHRSPLLELCCEVIKSDEGKNCCVTASTFFALPDIAALVNAVDISQEDREYTRIKFVEFIEASRQKVEGECAVKLTDVRRNAGLDSRGFNSLPWPETEGNSVDSETLVRHATAFWVRPPANYLFAVNVRTFADIMRALCIRSVQTFTQPDKMYDNWEHMPYRPTPIVLRIADALFADLCFPPSTTMVQMEELGPVFTCQRCTVTQRRMSWTDLVDHFFNEANLFAEFSARPVSVIVFDAYSC
ncbi:hypothetical protein DFH11DRAFT_1259176 [Phellopilus nigrolimitatus]|nr:hypothetical protein DFH11DRAFT_1259176 [Phellopilus nigrolimitatus]